MREHCIDKKDKKVSGQEISRNFLPWNWWIIWRVLFRVPLFPLKSSDWGLRDKKLEPGGQLLLIHGDLEGQRLHSLCPHTFCSLLITMTRGNHPCIIVRYGLLSHHFWFFFLYLSSGATFNIALLYIYYLTFGLIFIFCLSVLCKQSHDAL